MKTFILTNVEVVIETQNGNMTESEALNKLQERFSDFELKGVGHKQDGTIVFGYADFDE